MYTLMIADYKEIWRNTGDMHLVQYYRVETSKQETKHNFMRTRVYKNAERFKMTNVILSCLPRHSRQPIYKI